MFRQGLRRCAGLAGNASASLLPRSRALVPVARQGVASLARPGVPFRVIAGLGRAYSSEVNAAAAPAVEADADADVVAAKPAEATQFNDLRQLGVHDNLLRSIIEDMGYQDMTPVQAKTINPALKGTDIVAQAKTGTGKTLAFLLPMLQRMIGEDPSLASRRAVRGARCDDIRGIVLSPTRELAEQIAAEAKRVVRHTGLVVQSAVGGTSKNFMLRQTQRQGCHLLIATPGRLNDLLQDPASGIAAPNLAAFVLDEADRMLDVGFEKELTDILRSLPKNSEKVRQTILVSATIPDDVIRLARSMVRPDDFEFVQTIAENESLTHDRVPQHLVPLSSWSNVFPSLFELIDREAERVREDKSSKPFKAIVYFNTTALVQLAGELGFQRRRNNLMRLSTYSIQSNLSQTGRTKAAEYFRHAKSGVLFSSDVTARGMDFPDVTHVIQVDTPRDRESYIHRLGRTARQNKEGQGWLLLPPTAMSGSKKLLRGLPLKQNTSLEAATVNVQDGELPGLHQEMRELTQAVDRRILGSAYLSIFGASMGDKEELVDDLNSWTTHGWGWKAPPPVPTNWARQQGLLNTNLNIQDRPMRQDRDDGDDGEASSDPFADMKRRVRSDGRGQGDGFGQRGGYGGRGGRDGYGQRGQRDQRGGYGRRDRRGSGGSGGRGFGSSKW